MGERDSRTGGLGLSPLLVGFVLACCFASCERAPSASARPPSEGGADSGSNAGSSANASAGASANGGTDADAGTDAGTAAGAGSAGGTAPDAGAGGELDLDAGHPTHHLVPVVSGDFWQIAASPDLGMYDNRPAQQPVDFAIWQAKDGTWQLWSCIRGTNIGGNTRLFYHWEGQRLDDLNWQPLGIALMADPTVGETAGGLQAPYVLRVGDTWHMFYGDWEHICHATSSDGKSFSRVIGADGQSGVFSEGQGLISRDPMVFARATDYLLYYTTSDGLNFVRSSNDLNTFGASKVVARGGSAGLNCCSAECPFVVQPEPAGDYFLFRTQRYGQDAQTSVYRSADPFDFGLDDDRYLIETLPLAAPEIFQFEGRSYIAALRADLQGIQIAHLEFVPE